MRIPAAKHQSNMGWHNYFIGTIFLRLSTRQRPWLVPTTIHL